MSTNQSQPQPAPASATKWWVLGGIALVAVIGVVWLISSYNGLVRAENALKANHGKSKTALAAIMSDMKSQGLAVEKYGDMVMKALDASFKGRYGEKGVKAALIAIREDNPKIDAAVITKLQAVISSGYKHFEQAQNEVLAAKQAYSNRLQTFPSNIVASTFGFPTVDLDSFNLVLTEDAMKAFDTGTMKRIDPFEK